MWIMVPSGDAMINSDRCGRFVIVEKCDAILVSAQVDHSDKVATICKCECKTTAWDVLDDIAHALARGDAVWYAPSNFADRTMPKIMDSRVKRRGGS